MTYEQYWYGDPLMVRAFYKADKLRQKNSNSEAWLVGVYFKKAIESTVGNMFLEKNKEPIEYPTKPISLDEEGETDNGNSAEREKQEEAYAKLYMYNMVRAGKDWGNR